MPSVTRAEFLRALGRAVALAGLAPLVACADDAPAIDAAPPVDAAADARGMCLANGTAVTIATNHGHVLIVPVADVMARVARTYDITGNADHAHTVTLTAAHFTTLAGDEPVTVTSSVLSHAHQVTVYCV